MKSGGNLKDWIDRCHQSITIFLNKQKILKMKNNLDLVECSTVQWTLLSTEISDCLFFEPLNTIGKGY
jgi:hypothetical protein